MINVNGKTRTCGLIGNPVEHTLSPLIHNFLAEELDINMVYVPFHVEQGQLAHAVKGAYGLHILGCNVTVPYKNDVIENLVEIDTLAKRIGAVNTLVRTEGGYKGYNTDMTGLLRAMQSDGVEIAGEDVVILGAGGAARSVAFMCVSYGAKKVYMLNRTLEKAQQIADEVNASFETDIVSALKLTDYKTLPQQKYLVLQSTSVGLSPHDNDVVIEDADFYKLVKVGYDLIYNPWETRFMKLVKEHGGQSFNGLKMLLFQAIDAFELWNNCKISDERAFKAYELLQEAVRKK